MTLVISGFLIGTEISSLSPFLSTPAFDSYYGELGKREQALLSSASAIGAVFGCILGGTFGDTFGCVVTFQVSNLVWLLGSVIMIFLAYVHGLILGKLIKGITLGIIYAVVPVYMSEIFPIYKKGSFISVFHLHSTMGAIVMYFTAYLFQIYRADEYCFKGTWAVGAVPALLLLILCLRLPESPKWLASRSKWSAAAKTLQRVGTKKGGQPKNNITTVTRAYTMGPNLRYSTYAELFGRKYWKYTGVGIMVQCFIQLTCVTTVMYYFNYICQMCGLIEDTQVIAVSSHYILLGLFTFFPILLLDGSRRVDLLTFGFVLIGSSFAGITIIMVLYSKPIEFQEPREYFSSPFNWKISGEPASAIMALCLFIISVYSSSISSVSWLYTGEIFPDEARAKGTALCMCISWMVNGMVTLAIPLLFETIRFWTFLPLSLIGYAGSICIALSPETKSKANSNVIAELLKRPTDNQQISPSKEKVGSPQWSMEGSSSEEKPQLTRPEKALEKTPFLTSSDQINDFLNVYSPNTESFYSGDWFNKGNVIETQATPGSNDINSKPNLAISIPDLINTTSSVNDNPNHHTFDANPKVKLPLLSQFSPNSSQETWNHSPLQTHQLEIPSSEIRFDEFQLVHDKPKRPIKKSQNMLRS